MNLAAFQRPAALLALLACTTVAADAQVTDEATIRAVRAASNAAIAARDLSALRRTVFDDLNVTASSGSVFVGGDEMMERFRASFDDPEFVTYVRTPEQVTVSQAGDFGAESGRWVGSWRRSDGEMRVLGRYMAQWQRRAGEWRIRSELFVALSCEGSDSCEVREVVPDGHDQRVP
jgi:ketosteroid isomerase-like protein